MSSPSDNIHPVFDRMLQRQDKEVLLNQRGLAVWMTGLSGSGKTTIAIALEQLLHERGHITQLIDGDNIRAGINRDLGFSEADREENIRRIAEVTKLFVNCGIITINCFVSPTIALRNKAKEIIGSDDFFEVFINTPFDICEQRDVKGLYKKARAGEIKNFTGLDAPFEAPISDFIDITTADRSVEACAAQIFQNIEPRINFRP
jgi:adenylylsulfate kinase